VRIVWPVCESCFYSLSCSFAPACCKWAGTPLPAAERLHYCKWKKANDRTDGGHVYQPCRIAYIRIIGRENRSYDTAVAQNVSAEPSLFTRAGNDAFDSRPFCGTQSECGYFIRMEKRSCQAG